MKRTLKHLSTTALSGLVLFSLSSAYAVDLFKPGEYASYKANTENGKRVFHASACASCHGVEGNDKVLAGGRSIDTKFGVIHIPNITADKDRGIGKWSNADFLNAVMRGKAPDGSGYIGSVFPYASYANMKPEDALDMRAYMATLPSSDAKSKPHQINFLYEKLLTSILSPEPRALPAASDLQMARGQYLTEVLGHCAECHTPRKSGMGFSYDLDTERMYMGETGILGDYAPAITAEKLKKAGPQAFAVGVFKENKKLNGRPMGNSSMRRISAQMAQLSLKDRAAIYAYLTGESVNVSQLKDVVVGPVGGGRVESVTYTDNTMADGLVQRIESYCDAKSNQSSANRVAASGERGGNPDLMRQADELVAEYCVSCHGPTGKDRNIFPTVDIMDLALDPASVTPGNPDKSPLYESIASNRMPIGKKMSSEELAVLASWINSIPPHQGNKNTPAKKKPVEALPKFVGGNLTNRMAAVMADIDSIRDRDRAYIRYFTFAYMPLPEIDCNSPKEMRNPVRYLHAGLNKFINSVSRSSRLKAVQPVKGTDGSIVRIDIRDYGWTKDDWESLTKGVFTHGVTEAGFTAEAWKDMATVYPYALSPKSNPMLGVIARATYADVPIMRAEWFAHFGSMAPYYDLLLRLPADIKDLEHRMGIDVPREILNRNMVRAGFLPGNSGVSDHNRLLERFDLPHGGYYWKSYDFAGDIGEQSLSLHPDGPNDIGHLPSGTAPFEHDGGEMIFSLPNGMQGYYLSTAAGERLQVGPTSIVSFRKKEIGKGIEITNARSCFDCHGNGIIAKRDQMKNTIQSSGRYTRDQMEILLEVYPEQDELAQIYRRDAEKYIRGLSKLGAVQKSPSGRPVSLEAPMSAGGGEIVTYLADFQFDSINAETLAREFDLTPEEMTMRMRSVGDPHLMQTVMDWQLRLQSGIKIHRSELEEALYALMPRLTDYSILNYGEQSYANQYANQGQSYNGQNYNTQTANHSGSGNYNAPSGYAATSDYQQAALQALNTVTQQVSSPYKPSGNLPSYTPPAQSGDKLKLFLSVPKTNVRVNDLLTFSVSANRTCELQVLYIEETKKVVEVPANIIGPKFLQAGETRQIPFPGSGQQIRFNTPGLGETMVAFCREGGLGNKRITAASALQYAKTRFTPLSRGVIFEASNRVKQEKGQSAVNAVTFNVKP